MTGPLFQRTPIQRALAALSADLLDDNGPQISTMRNRPFAIVPYDPTEEFRLRAEVSKLTARLIGNGWVIKSSSLQKLLLDRVRAQGDDWVERVVAMEQRMAETHRDLPNDRSTDRGLNYLKSKLTTLLEGPDGIAGDCSRIIRGFRAAHPDKADRTLALIGRVGSLYPFSRSSALLRHLDGHTEGVPVVLLYPGTRQGRTGLSFMGALPPDNDYRPRIYS